MAFDPSCAPRGASWMQETLLQFAHHESARLWVVIRTLWSTKGVFKPRGTECTRKCKYMTRNVDPCIKLMCLFVVKLETRWTCHLRLSVWELLWRTPDRPHLWKMTPLSTKRTMPGLHDADSGRQCASLDSVTRKTAWGSCKRRVGRSASEREPWPPDSADYGDVATVDVCGHVVDYHSVSGEFRARLVLRSWFWRAFSQRQNAVRLGCCRDARISFSTAVLILSGTNCPCRTLDALELQDHAYVLSFF